MTARGSIEDAQRFLELLARPGDVFELRGLVKGRSVPQVTAGYFDDMGKLAAAAVDRSGKDDGVYITINPVNPALLARAPANRVRQAGNGDTTSDRDVQQRRHLLVDVDPIRPAGISSSSSEHFASIELAWSIAVARANEGWPEPILADSGNGGHLIYAIDLPVDDGGLVKRVLAELSRRHTSTTLKVDEKVFNPARISKMYGTLTRKGEDTDDRPHRMSRILYAPERLEVVDRELLERFAPLASPAPAKTNGAPHRERRFDDVPRFDLDAWIAEHLPDAVAMPWSEGRKWLLPICPFNSDHNRREAYVTEKHGGMIAAGCQHESCFKTWRELRTRFEPDAYERAPRLANGTQRISDREPPPEVIYQDASYDDVDAFADRDRDPVGYVPPREEPLPRMYSVRDAMEELAVLATMPVYPTPFPTLNDAIGFGGLIGTQVYTVAAGTGRGKTSWVAAVAAHAAQTVPVIVATYEMKPGYFITRKAAGLLGVHSNSLIRGHVSIDAVCNAMPFPRLVLLKKPTLKDLRRIVIHLKEKYGIAPLVIVDYLQKLAHQIAKKQSKPDLRLATSEASETLLEIGEETCAAIMAVSAIGRGKGKIMLEPRKHSPYELVEVAKESGDVEYDGAAMIVLTLTDEHDGDWRVGTMTAAKTRFGTEMHIAARYHGARGDWEDCGRVTGRGNETPRPTPPPNAGTARELANSETVIRDAILRVLREKGAQPSASEIAKLSGKNKSAALAEIKRMLYVEPPVLEKGRGGFIGLVGQVVPRSESKAAAPSKQAQLDALIATAEGDSTP